MLEVRPRDPKVSAKNLLASGFVPIIFYGKGMKNLELQVDSMALKKAYRQAGGNTVIELKVDGGQSLNALAYDVQYDPVTDELRHADFINVRMDQEIHTEIPLKFVGVSLAVKDMGGTLTSNVDVLKVKCLPKDLVHVIEVNIEPLVDFHTSIRVKDLPVPNGITVLTAPDEVVATAVPPHEEKEEAPVVAAAAVEGATAEGAVPAEGGASAEGAAIPAKGAKGSEARDKK